jgi:hypothetical protein
VSRPTGDEQRTADAWNWGGVDMTPDKFGWREGEAEVRIPMTAQVAAHDAMVRGVRMGTECVVHKHEEWVPLEDHHVWPKGMGGPDRPENIARVCSNGHGQIHAYLDLLIRYAGEPPWNLARRFGPSIRAFARRGWLAAGRPTRA